MAVSKIQVSPSLQAALGRDGIAELSASIWAVDCQVCGQPLGPEPPALAVDDLGAFAMATLNHEGCRAPEWSDWRDGPWSGPGERLTYRARLVMPRLSDLGQVSAGHIPGLLVNPSMETVLLTPDSDGTWHPEIPAAFAVMGMVPPGPALRPYKAIRGAVTRMTDSAVTVEIKAPTPASSYGSPLLAADARFAEEITTQGGVLLMVTYAADPHAAAELPRQFRDAIRARRLLCGWAPLSV